MWHINYLQDSGSWYHSRVRVRDQTWFFLPQQHQLFQKINNKRYRIWKRSSRSGNIGMFPKFSIQSYPYALFRTYASSKLSTYPMPYIFGGTVGVLLLGYIHEILNNTSSNAPEARDKQVTWVPPSSFEWSTHKYILGRITEHS